MSLCAQVIAARRSIEVLESAKERTLRGMTVFAGGFRIFG